MKRNISPRLILTVVTLALCSVLGWRMFLSERPIVPRVETAAAKTEPASIPSTPTSPPRPKQIQNSDEDGPNVAIVSDRPRFAAEVSPAQRRAGEKDVDLQKASVSLRDYRKAFKQNPVGNNAEITRLLLGQNSQGARYLPDDAHLNDKVPPQYRGLERFEARKRIIQDLKGGGFLVSEKPYKLRLPRSGREYHQSCPSHPSSPCLSSHDRLLLVCRCAS